MATSGPPRAEKLIFSDKTLACLNDCAPKRINQVDEGKNFCRNFSTKGNDDGSFGQRERLNEEVEVVQEGREGGGEVEGQDEQC